MGVENGNGNLVGKSKNLVQTIKIVFALSLARFIKLCEPSQ